MVIREIETLECISLEKVSVLQSISDSSNFELMRFYCDKADQNIDGYRIKGGCATIVKGLE